MGSAAAAPSLWRCGDGRCVWCTSPNAPGGIARVTNHDVGGRIALPQLGKRLDSTAPPPRLLLRGPSVNGSVRRASARRMCSNMSDLIVTTGHFSVRERSFLVAHSCLWLPTHVHLPLARTFLRECLHDRCTRSRTQGSSLAFVSCSRSLIADHIKSHLPRHFFCPRWPRR